MGIYKKMQLKFAKQYIPLFVLLLFVFSCNNTKEPETSTSVSSAPAETVKKALVIPPEFNSDSAYSFIKKQVGFGPRVPGSESQKKCASYLVSKFREYGMDVIVQDTFVTVFTGKSLPCKNIIGQFDVENKNRIVLMSHWDSRPFADQDKENRTKPIDAANDGASGVAVMIEIARLIQLSKNKPSVGIDFICFDVEDYGQPQDGMMEEKSDTWCLGSQYWSKNLHQKDYHPKYGILLDMVGAKDPVFSKEGHSMYYAANVVEKIWTTAARLGYTKLFINNKDYRGLTDDHYYVNTIAHIPTVDIVDYNPYTNSFGSYHHTHLDNISIIDKGTLTATSRTLLDVIYNE